LKTKIVVIALILVFTIMTVLPAHAQTAPQQLSVSILRIASIGTWGVVHVQDNFTVQNKATSAADYVDYGVPNEYRTNLRYISATDSQGKTLAIDANVNDKGGFYWFRINFAKPLSPNGTY